MASSFQGAPGPTEGMRMGGRGSVAYPLRTRHVEALRDARGGQRPLPPHPVAPPGEPAAGRGVAAASAPGVGQGAEGRALQPGPGADIPTSTLDFFFFIRYIRCLTSIAVLALDGGGHHEVATAQTAQSLARPLPDPATGDGVARTRPHQRLTR